MPLGYTCLEQRSPRSFLFYLVANVGPGGASLPLAVAYRQGNDGTGRAFVLQRVRNVVSDILRLLAVLSDPANRSALEAEQALAMIWYQHKSRAGVRAPEGEPPHESHQRPQVSDSPQPAFVSLATSRRSPEQRPELPWDDAIREFPFACTCLLVGLLTHDARAAENQRAVNTRLGDVQLQPLSTVFTGDCLEYGAVILDISDLNNVKYGIVAFPIRYMAEVYYRGEMVGWDPIEDKPPAKEPDVVLVESRPRVTRSILDYLRHYYLYPILFDESEVLQLRGMPLVDAGVLDYIWPPSIEKRSSPPQGIIPWLLDYVWSSLELPPSQHTATEPRKEIPDETVVERAIDYLLALTFTETYLDTATISKLQDLSEFQEQLRNRLEAVPHRLGPSQASAHLLRIAYAGSAHLNWVLFGNITYEIIAAAITSDDLQGAVALSIPGDDLGGDLVALQNAAARLPTLKQINLLQRPDRSRDRATSSLSLQLFKASQDWWSHDRTINLTCALSSPLRGVPWLPESISPPAKEFPVSYLCVRWLQPGQYDTLGVSAPAEDASYYLGDALIGAERFVAGLVQYLKSDGTKESLLNFAHATPAAATSQSPSSPSSVRRFAIGPVPHGIIKDDGDESAEDVSKRRRATRPPQPGHWIVCLTVEREPEHAVVLDDDDDDEQGHAKPGDATLESARLRYAMIKILDELPHDHDHAPESMIEVVGGLEEFMHHALPHIDPSLVKGLSETTYEGVVPESDQAHRLDAATARAMFIDWIRSGGGGKGGGKLA